MFERIRKLAESEQLTIAEIERLTGLKRGTIGKWSTSMPSADKLQKVANFLKVPMEYLLDGETSVNKKISVTRDNLMQSYDKLKKTHQERILERIETYLETYDDDKKI